VNVFRLIFPKYFRVNRKWLYLLTQLITGISSALIQCKGNFDQRAQRGVAPETEANGDFWSTYERGPSLVVRWARRAVYNIFLSCLGCSSPPSTKYYFPHPTPFTVLVPIALWAGGRAGSPVSVSLILTIFSTITRRRVKATVSQEKIKLLL
jgi:hypothetical protein